MSEKYLIVLVIIHICNGEEIEHLLSNKRNVTEESQIYELPTYTSQTYSNAFAAVVNSITWVPNLVASALGPIPVPPSIISPTNNGDKIDKFIIDFTDAGVNEDANLPIDKLIEKYGFPVEKHEVLTEDRYELTMFRIPSNGSVVFLMHGLLGSADDFVVAGRDSGLAYLLADAGYDVWMGNARGNKYSRKHYRLDPKGSLFWDFSWHEIGIFDLPAMIDYALNEVSEKSLKYIGFSQGTTSFFVMASERPEYNAKVSLMIALSPVAFMSNAKSPAIRVMSHGTAVLHGLSKSLGVYEFLPDNNLIRTLKLLVCGTGPLADILCSNTLFLMTGYDFAQLNASNLPVIFGHMPAGASTKQFVHYGQGILSKDFRKFDYGYEENKRRYSSRVPPSYQLENVITPVSLFFAKSDWLADTKDVLKLFRRLSNVVDLYTVPYQEFNHVDFILAKDVVELVYRRVLKVLVRVG